MITLHMEPKTPPCMWDTFVRTKPAYSIALDGYVRTGPRFDATGPYANFNHHEDCDRLATRATCAQVHMAIRQGLFDTFRTERGPEAHVWANDCDEDVCTAFFLLKHSHLSCWAMNPLLNRLVSMEDALDTTAGAYPFPADLPVLQELAWVYEPYRRFRLSGQLAARDADAFAGVVTDVGSRIMRHITGSGEPIPLDLRYETLHQGKGWVMVNEIGAHARTAMFGAGVRAFVSVRGSTYTIGRMSPFVKFDVPEMLLRLNEAEGVRTADRWGGSNTIGGSPRIAGSKLTPDEVRRVVEDVVG